MKVKVVMGATQGDYTLQIEICGEYNGADKTSSKIQDVVGSVVDTLVGELDRFKGVIQNEKDTKLHNC